MSSLKDALKPKSNKNNSSGKGPQYYNAEKSRCIAKMASHDDAAVRQAVLELDSVPTKVLTEALKIETDVEVLFAIMLNEKCSKKAASEFAYSNDGRLEAMEAFDSERMLEVVARFQE